MALPLKHLGRKIKRVARHHSTRAPALLNPSPADIHHAKQAIRLENMLRKVLTGEEQKAKRP